MWNPFKKNNTNSDDPEYSGQKMSMLQSLAMKKLAKMSPQEREKLTADMLKPENKDKLLSAMAMMKKSGMVSEAQLEEAKKRMGL